MTVEDAVSAQFTIDIPAFAKPTFERFRRTSSALLGLVGLPGFVV